MLWPLLFTTLSLLLLLKSPVSWSRYISEPFQCGLVLMGLSWLLAWWPVKLFVNPVTLKTQHFEFLDALRGLAALAVVVVHTLQNFDAGYWNGMLSWGAYGVQLFYIVSAYSLCLSISQRVGQGGFWKAYLSRRFFRIAPLFWLAVCVYLLRPFVLPMEFAPVDVHPPFWDLLPWHVVATLLFVNGWHYQSINFVVPGGWSVAIESNFYLLLPFLLKWVKSVDRAILAVVLCLVFSIALSLIHI